MKLVLSFALFLLLCVWRGAEAASCVDKFPSCPTLAKSFGCQQRDMQLNCPKACNLCSTQPVGVTRLQTTTPIQTTTTKAPYPRDCSGAADGVSWILPSRAAKPIQVFCTKGWQLLQSRSKGDVSFDRTWAEYRTGFGVPVGDYWVGLEHMHTQTSVDQYMLRVEVEINTGNNSIPVWTWVWDDYSSFSVAPESDGYRLKLGPRGSSNKNSAGNDLQFCNGKRFETKDKLFTQLKCASLYGGGFWMEETCGPNLHASAAICGPQNPICAVYGGVIRASRLLMKV